MLDIEVGVKYYNEQQLGLGKRFAKEVRYSFISIKTNPFYCGIRYNDIRCAVVSVFPFMDHYKIELASKTVKIISVYNTYRKE